MTTEKSDRQHLAWLKLVIAPLLAAAAGGFGGAFLTHEDVSSQNTRNDRDALVTISQTLWSDSAYLKGLVHGISVTNSCRVADLPGDVTPDESTSHALNAIKDSNVRFTTRLAVDELLSFEGEVSSGGFATSSGSVSCSALESAAEGAEKATANARDQLEHYLRHHED